MTRKAEGGRWRGILRDPWPLFVAAFLIAVAGFWPSFFAKLAETPLPHHIHGWSATAWMLLPLVQFALIRGQRRELHRRLGYVSLALTVLVAISGVYVVQMMAAHNRTRFNLINVKFVWLDLTGLALFAVLVVAAILAARRRDMRLHVMALVGTAFIPLEAALERLCVNHAPGIAPDFDAALYAALITLESACVLAIVVEWKSGRIRWPMPLLLSYYLLMHLSATPIAQSPRFQAFSSWVGAIGPDAPPS